MQDGLEDVEERLREVVVSAHPMLDRGRRATSSRPAASGSGRCWPCSPRSSATRRPPEVVDAAVVVELTHLATLYHDDVMDEADVRRGAPSANTRWTNTVAILTGDYLFARASDLTAGLGTEATHLQSRTFARLVEGQIAETAGPAEGQDPVEHHLQVLADKTGSLIATSARLGAMMAGAPAARRSRPSPASARSSALAFQLSDDLIDVAVETRRSPARRRAPTCARASATLPVLLVLASDDRRRQRAAARAARRRPDRRRPRSPRRSRLLRAHPAMDEARGPPAGATSTRPARSPGELPAGPARDALPALTDFVLARTG